MKIKFECSVETTDYCFEFEVKCDDEAGYEQKLAGRYEDSYPGEPDCIEDYIFTLAGASDEVGPCKSCSKAKLDSDEFEWWFGREEMERVEGLAYDAFQDAKEAEAESAAEERYDAVFNEYEELDL